MGDGQDQDGLDWRGDVPVSRRFDDPYYSTVNGLEETRHVFLQGNDLPRRWQGARGATVAELGFGTGLNVLAARALWREVAARGGVLRITSFEAYPMPRDDLARALAPWPQLDPGALLAAWPLTEPLDLGDTVLEVIWGDARETLPNWSGQVENWFLDGFSPARNPEMWEAALLQAVHDHTCPGGTAATYSAAGAVRRALSAAGFMVTRHPGYAGKRHMTRAERPRIAGLNDNL
ncbi:MAG: tRNA (5-methylaminomethyl-2-thiouridine)(34)-methyltransferase MnmD [Pseudomonadota bacterium]